MKKTQERIEQRERLLDERSTIVRQYGIEQSGILHNTHKDLANEACQKAATLMVRAVSAQAALESANAGSDGGGVEPAEQEFFLRYTDYAEAFEDAHVCMYLTELKLDMAISKVDAQFSPKNYNRDAVDALIANLAQKKGNLSEKGFSDIIAGCKFYKQQFGKRYLDSLAYSASGKKSQSTAMQNTESFALSFKNAVTKNRACPVASRLPKSPAEQELIDKKVKSIIAMGISRTVESIEAEVNPHNVSAEALAFEDCRPELAELAKNGLIILNDIADLLDNKRLLNIMGKTVSDEHEQNISLKQKELGGVVLDIDSRIDNISQKDKDKFWQQAEADGRMLFSMAFALALPTVSLRSFIETGESGLSGGTEIGAAKAAHRRKTDIVKKAMQKEKAMQSRERSPDPKTMSVEKSAPALSKTE